MKKTQVIKAQVIEDTLDYYIDNMISTAAGDVRKGYTAYVFKQSQVDSVLNAIADIKDNVKIEKSEGYYAMTRTDLKRKPRTRDE